MHRLGRGPSPFWRKGRMGRRSALLGAAAAGSVAPRFLPAAVITQRCERPRIKGGAPHDIGDAGRNLEDDHPSRRTEEKKIKAAGGEGGGQMLRNRREERRQEPKLGDKNNAVRSCGE